MHDCLFVSIGNNGVFVGKNSNFEIYSTPNWQLLSTLHWLPVRRRIDFKIAVLTYKLLSTRQPSCLACKITPYVSGRRLRSSESETLTVPRIKTVIGSHAFRSAAPFVWNLIPVDIRTAPSLDSFRVKLKTHYFQVAFC